jgi:SAM-dependent methyltransferase
MTTDCSYTPAQFAEKEAFVTEALRQFPPSRLLDIGCNTGHFSAIAARAGASVVAVDADPTVVGQTWQRARSERLDMLPLVGNLARPSPALGWRNSECPSFLSRATGAFDGLLMLAVIHHLLATERVPLHELLELASELTTNTAIIELVGPNDPMFRRISRGRDDLYRYLTPALFEQACLPYFEIVRSKRLTDSERWLYLLERRR